MTFVVFATIMFEEQQQMDVDDFSLTTPKPTLRKDESEWINTVLKKGTLNDKLAAHTLLIHESKNWASLDGLIDMVNPKKCRRQCVLAMNTLKELFLESLNFCKKNSNITSPEDIKKIKYYFVKFVDHLYLVAFDSLEETRKRAIWILSTLLTHHGDNKEYILEKLVFKIGDKTPKVASIAANLLTKAINSEKEDLRAKAVKSIQRMLKNPKLEPKTKYYAIGLLSRIKLLRNHHDVANNLIEIYLDIFDKMAAQKSFDSRLMSTVFIGLNRVYPYSNVSTEVFEQHLQTLYTIVHHVNYKESVTALSLMKKIVTKRAQTLKLPIEDRFYNVVYKKLLQQELQRSSGATQFLNLLLSLINEDQCLDRKIAFVKRMLQVAVCSRTQIANQILLTITMINSYSTLFAVDESMETDDNDEDSESGEEAEGCSDVKAVVQSSWVHVKAKNKLSSYDPFARNPKYVCAKKSKFFELYLLRSHYDESVSDAAKKIISSL